MHTILVVDDEGAIVELLATLLADAGYRVLCAAQGHAALECLAHAPVDLVLTDVMMPGLTGGALCAHLQADPAYRAIPVVLMSAGVRATPVAGCAYAAWLAKPFAIEEVLQIVEQVLAAPGRPEARAPANRAV